MSTSSSQGSGIFAKLVAKFLVKWIKKTRSDKGSSAPALSAAPPQVEGRPERDRSRETIGAHTGSSGPRASEAPAPAAALQGGTYGTHAGSTGPRASEAPAPATALQGGTYGTHTGSTGPRASEAPAQATALQGGTYGSHRGVSTRIATIATATYDPVDVERRLAAMWNTGEKQARGDALRSADPGTLREAGMNQQQVAQAGNGRVPAGYQMERVPGTDAAPSHYQLAPTSAQSQCNCNHVNQSITEVRFGNVSVISLPIGGQQVTIVLGGGATLAG
ncbi:hypothetical protein BW730_10310 [Tessaracoccus aquimaris]|uniref:Uncharacterized protein n=1 Tax=Tessaracoccus aquimaris TaxID=1332264 RepID=A0A1Q2CNY1_9ACTN|nr:hypothetical protein [Tessaracoccus aquimaris]AQP47828.1 hypothetical protein BW730_10310 [Tessaracoccus aquimaris]